MNNELSWKEYCLEECAALDVLLKKHDYTLEEEQPHTKGERYLMQAVTTTSGRKLILFGRSKTNKRVVIKATRDKAGQEEIMRERCCRDLLNKIDFAAEIFETPPEIAFIKENGFMISIQAFVEQPCSFLERPTPEQFDLALAAFKAQEGAHATTYKHRKRISRSYEMRDGDSYLRRFKMFVEHAATTLSDNKNLHALYQQTHDYLVERQQTIEQYSGFLTHTDFVPHNIRIDESGTMYLLDHSSLAFGNKYEGWARFLNFMTLYNPKLEQALTEYVANNRSPEESESLHLMRLYRLGEIIHYYLGTLARSEGDLHALNRTRVDFWATVLSCQLNQIPVPDNVIALFKQTRDSLRSDAEKSRQRGLH